MNLEIDRAGPLPFYYQLKQILLADIKRRRLAPGDRLAGDHQLCETYNVSRTVVRQALAELEAAGAIERFKGRGTFVAQPKTAEGLVQSLTGLYEDVAARGGHLTSQVRRRQILPADEELAVGLQVPIGTPVIVLERLRFVDAEPWVLTVTHIPYGLAPGLEHEDFTEQSLYALLEGKYGVALHSGRRSVEAAPASAELAKCLGIGKGGAVLVLRSTSVGVNGQPVETFVAYHRGDRSRFEVELVRAPTGVTRPMMLVTSK